MNLLRPAMGSAMPATRVSQKLEKIQRDQSSSSQSTEALQIAPLLSPQPKAWLQDTTDLPVRVSTRVTNINRPAKKKGPHDTLEQNHRLKRLIGSRILVEEKINRISKTVSKSYQKREDNLAKVKASSGLLIGSATAIAVVACGFIALPIALFLGGCSFFVAKFAGGEIVGALYRIATLHHFNATISEEKNQLEELGDFYRKVCDEIKALDPNGRKEQDIFLQDETPSQKEESKIPRPPFQQKPALRSVSNFDPCLERSKFGIETSH